MTLVEHMGGAPLDRGLKKHLGIGNSTGLGMAPFLVSHPVLLNNWMVARETALARVRAVETLSDGQITRLRTLANRAARHLGEWQVPEAAHQQRIDQLRGEWQDVIALLQGDLLHGPEPLDHLIDATKAMSCDAQELTVSLALEPFGDLIDGLADCMTDPFGLRALPYTDTDALRAAIEAQFDWALTIDFDDQGETQQFWYVSEEKLEPRLGDRHNEPGADLESPLDIARRVQALWRDLPETLQPLRTFRNAHPQHELALRRVLTCDLHPYAEIRDNLIGQGCLPIDMLRCKLSFFGASKFDPKSDRWTRITLAQGAPLPDELTPEQADDWWLPVFEA